MKTVLLPYMNFMGSAGEAMKFYKSIFGGDLTMQTYKDAGMSHEEADDNKVIHSELKAPNFSFMASDGNKDHPVKIGDNVQMSLMGDDEKELTDWFQKLSEGGKVDLPLAKQFWGDTYGQLTDKFGIHWTVNISSGAPQK